MAINTSRGFLRTLLAAALTQERTTTEFLETGIIFTESHRVTTDEVARGCWTLVPESREPGEAWSEDSRDQSAEAEATVKVMRKIGPDENVDDVGDAMIDSVQRAIETYMPDDMVWAHEETNETIRLNATKPFEIGLNTPTHNRESSPAVASVVLYITIHYDREPS